MADIATEETQHRTQQRSNISLKKVSHNDNLCREFIIQSEKFNYQHWLMLASAFTFIGYLFHFHLQVRFFLLTIGNILLGRVEYSFRQIWSMMGTYIYPSKI